MLITLVGVPILAGTLLAARGLGWFDRVRANALLKLDVVAPPLPAGRKRLPAAALHPVPRRGNWKASAYLLLMLPVGVVNFSIAVTIWSAALSALFLPATRGRCPAAGPRSGTARYVHGPWRSGSPRSAGCCSSLPRRGSSAPSRCSTASSSARCSARRPRMRGSSSCRRRGPARSTRPSRSAGASSATCTTGPSSGSSGSAWISASRSTSSTRIRPEPRPRRRGPPRGPARDRRASRPRARAPPGRARGPRLDAALSALAARSPVPVALSVECPCGLRRRSRRTPTSSSPRR